MTIVHVPNLDEQFSNNLNHIELAQEYTITLSTINTANDGVKYKGIFKRASLIGHETAFLHNVNIVEIDNNCDNLIKVLEITAQIAEDLLKSRAVFLQDTTVNLVYGYTEWIINIESNDI